MLESEAPKIPPVEIEGEWDGKENFNYKPKWRSTKENLLTPRPCNHCGQWMTREFLEWKRKARNVKLSRAGKK